MSEPRDLVTAEAVQRAVLDRIMTGLYPPGARLPSVRELAGELGSNRNTVNKAYQNLLGLGVIEAGDSSREGFRVKGLAGVRARHGLPYSQHFAAQVTKLVWEGMAAGMSAEEVLEVSARAVQNVYKRGALRLAFYECNAFDSREMGGYLSSVLNADIACGVLSDFQGRPSHLAQDFDLVITTFHHLAEIIRQVPESRDKVVGIDTRLTSESLLGVAHLPGKRIGIVCGVEATAHMLGHVLHGYYPHLALEAVTLDDAPGVVALAQKNDHIVATHTCAREVEALIGRPVDVVVNFQVDEQSLSYLEQRIQKIRAGKLAEVPAVQGAPRGERARGGGQ